jgi:5-methylcytosine-specific restriction endonuclease McrA
MNTKICTKCHNEFPATLEYFREEKRTKIGLYSVCKHCEILYNREYRKSTDAREKHRISAAEWRSNNRDRVSAISKRWRSKNRDKVKVYKLKYSSSHRIQESKRASDWYYTHNEQAAKQRKKWRIDNKEKYKDYYRNKCRNRRAIISGAKGTHSKEEIAIKIELQKHKCYYCGEIITNKYHVDHVVPVSRGGSNDIDNLVITCQFCNISKGARLLHEWKRSNMLI